MTADEARWIVEWATETGSLVFLWVGSCGVQPILMPGDPFYWWLDDPSVFQTTKGDGGTGSRTH
jgi:hypothetical protein